MQKVLAVILIILVFGLALYFYDRFDKNKSLMTPISKTNFVEEKPLDKYTFKSLQKRKVVGSEITIDKIVKDENDYISRLFFFRTGGKKESGLINIPKKPGTYPVIIMIRGYVDRKIYEVGVGTQHAGEVFAQNGFVTLAPDFLGYGESDKAVKDPMEDRFLTYITILNLIASVKNLHINDITIDDAKIGIWGHSNGGQIALSVLEISGKKYPTVLWAPVSKSFPYSILYYTDDIEDHGKALRKVVSTFENDYDSEKYSLTNYFKWIKAPIELYQGGKDEAVPQKWSDDLATTLKDHDVGIEYFTYPVEDHNFSRGSWSTIVQKNIEFYNLHLRK